LVKVSFLTKFTSPLDLEDNFTGEAVFVLGAKNLEDRRKGGEVVEKHHKHHHQAHDDED
jgi:hypothetical protein